MVHGTFTRLAVTVGLMIPIGFALGTLVLLGPVRWVTSFLRNNGAPSSVESLSVIAIIIALVLVTAAIAWALSALVLDGPLLTRIALPIVVLVLAGAAWALWLDTSLVASLGAVAEATETTPGFTFGPYPDEATLRRLELEGYAGVISLLHPAVVPFEPQLLEREREATARVGIQLIHLPMLPWVSSNEESLERLAALAANPEGRYYVHCYLGKDRVRLAQGVIRKNATAEIAIDGSRLTQKIRTIDSFGRFERGAITRLSSNVVFGPYPTPEEFSGFIADGSFEHVVALTAPDSERVPEETAMLAPYPIEFHVVPLTHRTINAQTLAEAVEHVRNLEGPVYIHSFFSTDTDRSGVATQFVDAYRKSLSEPVAGSPQLVSAITNEQ